MWGDDVSACLSGGPGEHWAIHGLYVLCVVHGLAMRCMCLLLWLACSGSHWLMEGLCGGSWCRSGRSRLMRYDETMMTCANT